VTVSVSKYRCSRRTNPSDVRHQLSDHPLYPHHAARLISRLIILPSEITHNPFASAYGGSLPNFTARTRYHKGVLVLVTSPPSPTRGYAKFRSRGHYTILMNLNFRYRFSRNNKISNFMKIRSVGAALFYADRRTEGRTDRQTERHDEANHHFSQFFERV
jgi:hypothetical protein